MVYLRDKVVAIGAHCAQRPAGHTCSVTLGHARCCIGLCLRRRSAARAARLLSMPPKKRRGSGWERRPRRSDAPAESPTKPESAPSDHSTGDMQHAEGTEKIVRWRKVLIFATDLWCSDYKPFMQAERGVNLRSATARCGNWMQLAWLMVPGPENTLYGTPWAM